jgi:hypothetical protein
MTNGRAHRRRFARSGAGDPGGGHAGGPPGPLRADGSVGYPTALPIAFAWDPPDVTCRRPPMAERELPPQVCFAPIYESFISIPLLVGGEEPGLPRTPGGPAA